MEDFKKNPDAVENGPPEVGREYNTFIKIPIDDVFSVQPITVQLIENNGNYDWTAVVTAFEKDKSLLGRNVKVHFSNRGTITSVFSSLI